MKNNILKKLNNFAGLFLILMVISFILIIPTQNPAIFFSLSILFFLSFWIFNIIYAFKNKEGGWAIWMLVTIIALPVGFGISLGYFIMRRYNLWKK